MTILAKKIALSPVNFPDDAAFLKEIYISNRTEDLVLWSSGLGEQQAKHLLEMQYEGQKNQYQVDFPFAVDSIILFNKIPVGRFLVARNEREIRGVDLNVLPEYRNLGIGTVLLNDAIKEASKTNRLFKFRVLKNNRAIRLYLRLGCQVIADEGSHYAMGCA